MKFKFLRQIFTNPPKKNLFYFLDHYPFFVLLLNPINIPVPFFFLTVVIVVGALALVTSRTKKKNDPDPLRLFHDYHHHHLLYYGPTYD